MLYSLGILYTYIQEEFVQNKILIGLKNWRSWKQMYSETNISLHEKSLLDTKL